MTDAEHFACLDGISKQCSTILDAVRALKPEPSGYAEGYWEQVATHQQDVANAAAAEVERLENVVAEQEEKLGFATSDRLAFDDTIQNIRERCDPRLLEDANGYLFKCVGMMRDELERLRAENGGLQAQLDGSREGRERERAALHRFREREPELRKVLDEVHGYLMRGAHPRLFGAVDAVRNFKIDG